MNYGSILATFALCRLLNNKSGKVSEFKEKMKQGGLWQGVKNRSYGNSGSFSRVEF